MPRKRVSSLLLLCLGLAWPCLAAAAALPDPSLTIGLAAIRDRALGPMDFDTLAFDGLRALGRIDPAVAVLREGGGRIGLFYKNQPLALFPPPPANDAAGWALLIQAAAQDVDPLSPPLHAAGLERVRTQVFNAILSHLDRFSRYAPPGEAIRRRQARDGFGGIGVQCRPTASDVTLVGVLPGAPADKARLQAGDHILAVDGTPLAGLDADQVSALMRGPVHSPVALTVRSGDGAQARVITLTRDHILPPTATLSDWQDGIATIALTGFSEGTDAELAAILDDLARHPGSGLKMTRGLILDLRGNSGGLLDHAVAVASLFLGQGRVTSTRGRNPASLQTWNAQGPARAQGLPLVVLVDGTSASAAEILASALQDSGRAVLVGTNSYGKGTVQYLQPLPNGGELALTWSRYYSPSGYALHGLGVLPQVCTAGALNHPERALDRIAADPEAPRRLLAGWRSSRLEETGARRALRRQCPAENHAGDPTDPQVARRLLDDPALYRRLLAPDTAATPSFP
ncbi:putative CtpA-like serine protease [mine drainage metagenome]|uniref:Putative CtpA-like serine protease n=1 Tax=mine drainage metagenome TaxID=410659 RepID=A0A1J5RHG3_9ZZZZ